jgi:hypothetical protein
MESNLPWHGKIIDPRKESEVYDLGRYLEKIAMYLKDDNEEKWKLVSGINNTNNSSWVSVEPYNASLQRWSERLKKYIEENEDPFSL